MRYQKTNERRAVILMVVLSLLTLFALVGITFVLYADAEAAAARVSREAETAQRADVPPEQALAYFLGQFIYGVNDDSAGVGSALRGHELSRTMYGYYYLSGAATYNNATITMTDTTGLSIGSWVTVFSNSNPANHLITTVANVTANASITLASNWPFPTSPPVNGVNPNGVFIKVDSNATAFNGVGRLHYSYPAGFPAALATQDDYTLINYTLFASDPFVRDPERYNGDPTANALHPSAAYPQSRSYVGGNAPYTYADLNNLCLAAVKADGTILSPSFHRGYTGFGTLDPSNPNWYSGTADLKYKVLRPRPADHITTVNGTSLMLFPPPEDAGGDVRNLPWGIGGTDAFGNTFVNDSFWMDLGAPVMTAPDGTLYKMLFAPLILDLDGRINLNTAGNILGSGNAHVSNQGWGPWEVNLAKVLCADQVLTGATATSPTEYVNLFKGSTTTSGNTVAGRYISNSGSYTPSTTTIFMNGTAIPAPYGTYPHFYAPVDFNGLNEASTGTPSSRPTLPSGATWYASFANGYLNGGTTTSPAEDQNHPLLFDVFQSPLAPIAGTRLFRPSDMEALLRPNLATNKSPVDANASALVSDLIRLCPTNLGPTATLASANSTGTTGSIGAMFRNFVTTLSMDLGTPGVLPYWYSSPSNTPPNTSSYPYPATPIGNALLAPVSNASQFPTITVGSALPAIYNTSTTPANPSEFGVDWRAVSALAGTLTGNGGIGSGRIRLNQPLPPYPHMGSNLMPPYAGFASNYGVSYDTTISTITNQLNSAVTARQNLANQIYRTLLALTGVTPVATPATPTNTELIPRRWLAQLAVNIVDFIDEDDICTPFNFYSTTDGLAAANIGATIGNDDNNSNTIQKQQTGANPLYWVFGTELPKVVLNEVLAEATDPSPTAAVSSDTVNVWVELLNTMVSGAGTNTQTQDSNRVPLWMSAPAGIPTQSYSPYIISIAQNLMPSPPTTANPPAVLNDASQNVLGKANNLGSAGTSASPLPWSTTFQEFNPSTAVVNQMGTGAVPANSNSTTVSIGVDPAGAMSTGGTPTALSQYFLIGPGTPGAPLTPAAAPYQDPFVAKTGTTAGVPTNTPVYRTPNLSYTPNWAAPSTTDERTTGLTVMLRRLANPYLPLQPNPAVANYNPYITVDYLTNIQIQTATGTGTFGSRVKHQPYASFTSTVTPNTPPTQLTYSPVVDITYNATPPANEATNNGVTHSFGMQNPLPASLKYDWLVHLDRPPISPMELLHISGFQPYMLTQRFIVPTPATSGGTIPPGDDTSALNMFHHYVPWLDYAPVASTASGSTTTPGTAAPWWYDPNPVVGTGTLTSGQTHRLSRLFEFLECGDRATGVWANGRIPGKVNINTVYNTEILRALLDANSSGMAPWSTTPPAGSGISYDNIVDQIFNTLLAYRSPGTTVGSTTIPLVPTSTDRPFWPLSIGLIPTTSTQFPNTAYSSGPALSVQTDTILRMALTSTSSTPSSNQLLLLQNPGYSTTSGGNTYAVTGDSSSVHPYLQTQLLTKLYNNITTRSNTFAVFLTVGFFQVTNAATSPPTLGAEIGRSEGRQVRHRMFAIVDRTNLSTLSTSYTGSNITVNSTTGPQTVTMTPATSFGQTSGYNPMTGMTWSIGAGSTLVFEPGTDNEETVVLQPTTPPSGSVQATFYRTHNKGVTVIQRGNPGPWNLMPYDPRLDPLVVRYFSIID